MKMKEVFVFLTILIACSAFTKHPTKNITQNVTENARENTTKKATDGFKNETTVSVDRTTSHDEYMSQETGEFNETEEYTGSTPLTERSTRSVRTKSTLWSRPTFDTPRTTLFHRYVFESVDYYELPTNLRDYYSDCYAQNIRCVRHRTDHNQVCGYNIITRYYDDYYGPCEIELQNCLYRVKEGFGITGNNYTNDIIFYNGEGFDCIYYLRRTKTMEEMHKLYFGAGDEDEAEDYE